ncbi:ABC transporter permease [Rhodocytophaga aerolata]|uniref:ABC transporter permease n=1 Tax=Rhodocytophaga aerolata TaxID=455078 RepID=A0ABT8R3E8_9BACT|nr:ABC transporter permease [Rhodocytophaga aerolata]MDO1445287.1 ABC transporter permease [Rhodocytophaga aerolata]
MKKASNLDQPPTPPKWGDKLIEWFCDPHLQEEVIGDLHERFHLRTKNRGIDKAKNLYIREVISYIRLSTITQKAAGYSSPLFLHPDMIRNYLTIAYRNLIRNKGYSLINIGGFAVGMAVAMLIGLWVWDETSYNKYHRNYHRIAQVLQNQTFDGEVRTWWSQAMQLAPELRSNYGDNFTYVITASWTNDRLLSVGDKVLTKSGNFMEPQISHMLTLHMLEGTREGLKEPNSILLSESVAKAFFGDASPLGQLMKIDHRMDVKVTGVYEDLPANSDFANLGFIAPFDLLVRSDDLEQKVGWGNSWFQTLVQIADNADMDKVSAIIKNAKKKKVTAEEGARFKPELFLHPMSRWHLYSDFENGKNAGGRIEYVWLFGIVGMFVLLLACINFMNLSTARSEKRAKEVGIRKTIGSLRSQLISQFMSESLLVALVAFTLAVVLVWLLLPAFNEVADKKIAIAWTAPSFWMAGIGFTCFTGFLAGSYPALYLSAFNPVKVLKGTFQMGRLATLPRKVLVVVQFTVSVTLIVGTVVVYKQIEFAKNRPVGYSRDGVFSISIKTDEVRKNFTAFRNNLLQTGTIVAISQSESPVTNTWITNSGFVWKGKDPNMQDEVVTMGITHDFGKTISWKIREGRDFSTAFATDSSGFILNEAAVKYMGLQQPIGEVVKAFGREYTIIGVVNDMVMQSIYEPVRPTVFYIDSFNRVGFINVKIHPQVSPKEALEKSEATFKKHFPATPFEYKFADEDFAAKYQAEERIGKLAAVFATLAIFISCLGLFGLASFTAEQRTKEIGIRKVLGASVLNVWGLLSREFVLLVCIAFLTAAPIAYYFLSGWLQNYTYRISLSWWIFALSGAGALLVTLLTVSFQAIKAALANPVKSLRNE